MMCELLFIVVLSTILIQASIYLISYVWMAAAYKRNYFNSNSNSPFCQFWGLTKLVHALRIENSFRLHTEELYHQTNHDNLQREEISSGKLLLDLKKELDDIKIILKELNIWKDVKLEEIPKGL